LVADALRVGDIDEETDDAKVLAISELELALAHTTSMDRIYTNGRAILYNRIL
jgi:hypothetical protein